MNLNVLRWLALYSWKLSKADRVIKSHFQQKEEKLSLARTFFFIIIV